MKGAIDYTVCIFEAYDDSGPKERGVLEEVQGTTDYAKVEQNLTNGHHYEWYVIARGSYAKANNPKRGHSLKIRLR
ncbi:MAG: hypothetical protein M0C28_29150 [Candidatus Moduliflexus flocculans]|nr:hypothetical protein [Candidatus Moduliflexus flocculans]